MNQQRWVCRQCQREWVWAYRWTEADGCPACHGSNIAQVTYRPEFPGGDVPRVADDLAVAATVQTIVESSRSGALTLSDPASNDPRHGGPTAIPAALHPSFEVEGIPV